MEMLRNHLQGGSGRDKSLHSDIIVFNLGGILVRRWGMKEHHVGFGAKPAQSSAFGVV